MNKGFQPMTYGTSEGITIKELSTLINVGLTTLRTWETNFQIDVPRNTKNERRYTENIVNIFQEIKQLTTEGYTLKQIKNLLDQRSAPYGNQTPRIEIIQDEPPEETKFDLALRPFLAQITEYKQEVKELRKNNSLLIEESATLKERVKNKDEIISLLQQQKEDLENRLNKKWWKFWE